MPKLTLSDVNNLGGNPVSAQQVINTNSERIEAAIEKTLSRDGTSPNQMEADFDMNHYDVLNAGTVYGDKFVIDGVEFEGTASWIVASGAPGTSVGKLGDVYLDSLTGDVYGPKTSSGWGSVAANIKGPQGIQGPQGVQGIQGVQGLQGMQGPQGLQGPQGVQGVQGEKGDSFSPDAIGLSADRVNYDGEPQGFSFLDSQTGYLYFKLSATSGDWSPGITFTTGPQGPVGPQGVQGPEGPQGVEGPQGPIGPAGVGVPTGGAPGQILTKNTGTDYDTSWQDSTIPNNVNIDTRSTITTTNIPVAVNYLQTAGYSSVGDGGHGLYFRVGSEPTHAGKVQSLDGAWWELSDIELNVLQFGAVADSTGVGVGTDNSAIFNSAMLAAISLRRNLYIPAGGYRLSSPLVYDKSALNGDSGFVPNIRGAGVSLTRIYCDVNGLDIMGSTVPGRYGSFIKISDMHFIGASVTAGSGIYAESCGFVELSRIRCQGFYYGVRFKGVISSKLTTPYLHLNRYGFYATPDDTNAYPPNAITIDQPWIASNTQCGVYMEQPATFNIRGGSVEGNGTDTSISVNTRGGIILINPGRGGHNAVVSEGVYYEHNIGSSDVILSGSTRTFSALFSGNSFTRTDPAAMTTYNILATGATHPVTINLSGNGHGELGSGLVPTTSQRYVHVVNNDDVYTVSDIGNQYTHPNARPNYEQHRVISNNIVPYAMGFITSAGAVEGKAFNIASSEKLATGQYKITFGAPISGRKFAVVSLGSVGQASNATFDDNSITVNTFNGTGVQTDREFGVVVYTTAWW